MQTVTSPYGKIDITHSHYISQGDNCLVAVGFDGSESTLILPAGVDPLDVIERLAFGASVIVDEKGGIWSIRAAE